ncbi:MAG: hypothetical protein WC358_00010 [Ignavibacteria bacterium]|jgi:peptidoglycan hydrolase CwlO-like protein
MQRDNTGISQTCPLIDKVKDFIESETIEDVNISGILDTLEEIRTMNTQLRDIACTNITKVAELENDVENKDDEIKRLESDNKEYQEEIKKLESKIEELENKIYEEECKFEEFENK